MTKENFFWFRENKLTIPGVKRNHLFMHISDTHLNVCDERSSEDERKMAEEHEDTWLKYKKIFADRFGDPHNESHNITTLEAFEKQLALAAELKPETLLMSGDNFDYMHPAGERYLAKRLSEYGSPYICVPGNHEAEEYPGGWEAGVRSYAYDGFRIVALDNSKGKMSQEDLNVLKQLCDDQTPIILLCHVPMITPSCEEQLRPIDPYFYIDRETADGSLCELSEICEKDDTIKAILCGHVHGYFKTEIAPGKPQIIGAQGMAGAVHLLTVTGD